MVMRYRSEETAKFEVSQPGAQDWAQAAGTINYEIVTRMGPRLPRVYVGGRG